MKCYICKNKDCLEKIDGGSYKCSCGGGWDNKNKKWVKKMGTPRKKIDSRKKLISLCMLGAFLGRANEVFEAIEDESQ